MISMTFLIEFRGKKKRVSEVRTDGPTDRPSYRDAWMHLKIASSLSNSRTMTNDCVELCYQIIFSIYRSVMFYKTLVGVVNGRPLSRCLFSAGQVVCC